METTMTRADLPQDWTEVDYATARAELGLPESATAQEIADAWTQRQERQAASEEVRA